MFAASHPTFGVVFRWAMRQRIGWFRWASLNSACLRGWSRHPSAVAAKTLDRSAKACFEVASVGVLMWVFASPDDVSVGEDPCFAGRPTTTKGVAVVMEVSDDRAERGVRTAKEAVGVVAVKRRGRCEDCDEDVPMGQGRELPAESQRKQQQRARKHSRALPLLHRHRHTARVDFGYFRKKVISSHISAFNFLAEENWARKSRSRNSPDLQ